MFRGCTPPLHFDVYVSGYFNDLVAVAFLPPPRSPAKNMREPRPPPLLSHWNNEATPPTRLPCEARAGRYRYTGKRTPWTRTNLQTPGDSLDFPTFFKWSLKAWPSCSWIRPADPPDVFTGDSGKWLLTSGQKNRILLSYWFSFSIVFVELLNIEFYH